MNDKSIIALAVLVLSGYIGLVFAGMASTPTPQPIPTPFDVSTVDFSKFTPEEIAATEAHRDQLKGEVKQAQDHQAEVIADQGSSIAEIKDAANDAKKSFDAYRKAAEEEITQGNKAKLALAALVKKHHLDLIILCGLWVGFVALLYLKAGTMLGPVGIYISGGLAIAGVGFILWRL